MASDAAMKTDLSAIERRLARAYERGRVRSALLVALPLAALPLCSVWAGTSAALGCVAGALLVASSFVFLWRGRLAGRAVVPGVIAGSIPMACALIARTGGHLCTEHMCLSLCIPACFGGGVAAGLLIARWARRSPRRWTAAALAGSLAAVVGSLGCSCAGYTGVMSLLVGMTAVSLPALARPVRV